MGIQIKLQIEIDDVEDAQLLRAIESLLKTAKQTNDTDNQPQSTDVVETQQRRRKPPKPRFPDGSPVERFNLFCAALPTRARQFITLVEEAHPNVLSQSEAMRALNLGSAKAIGGITGSINRWAAVDAIPLPWIAEQSGGERVWRWIGLEAAQHGLSQALPNPSDVGLDDYAQLSPRLFDFLSLIHDAGQISAESVEKRMELPTRAALTGLESSLKRWAPTRGLPLPIEVTGTGSDRMYRWSAGPARSHTKS